MCDITHLRGHGRPLAPPIVAVAPFATYHSFRMESDREVLFAAPNGTSAGRGSGARMGVACVIVGLITLAVFLPSLRNGFVNWDDDENFLKNTNYRGLASDNIRWMFTTFHYGPYQPLSW